MNQRITHLALKASDPKTGWLDRQKFAELIVRECVGVADDGGTSGLEEYRCRDMGMDATGTIAITMERAIADAMKGKVKGHHDTVM